MSRCYWCANGMEHEFKHGTGGYSNHGCRCEICVEAIRSYNKSRPRTERRCTTCASGIKHEFKHGANGYRFHGCRCDVCSVGCSENYEKYRETILARRKAKYADDQEYREKISKKGEEYRQRPEFKAHRSIRDAKYRERNKAELATNGEKFRKKVSDIPTPREMSDWTAEDEATIMREDLTLIDMCYMLGRSYAAIRTRRWQNRIDMDRPGRLFGEKHNMSKLDDSDVSEIVKLLATREYSQTEIGAMFGVTQYAISGIASGKTWTHITNGPVPHGYPRKHKQS